MDNRLCSVDVRQLGDRVHSYSIDHGGNQYKNTGLFRFALEEDSLAARLQREQLEQWESEASTSQWR